MRSNLKFQEMDQLGPEWPGDAAALPARIPPNSVHLVLVQTGAVPLEPVQRPSGWAPIALRVSLGFVGTMFTALSLWSLAPPPL